MYCSTLSLSIIIIIIIIIIKKMLLFKTLAVQQESTVQCTASTAILVERGRSLRGDVLTCARVYAVFHFPHPGHPRTLHSLPLRSCELNQLSYVYYQINPDRRALKLFNTLFVLPGFCSVKVSAHHPGRIYTKHQKTS